MSRTRRKAGQLGPHVEGYRVWLSDAGYTPETIRNMLKELGHVGRWLSSVGLTAGQLNDERIAQFLAARPTTGRRKSPRVRAMAPLLTYLRAAGIAAEAQPPLLTPLTALLGQYRHWMVTERGLAPTTVPRYENTARRFLQEQAFRGEVFEPAALSGADVNEFLLRECARVAAGSATGRVAELRSVLCFLYLQGITALRLGTAVPPSWARFWAVRGEGAARWSQEVEVPGRRDGGMPWARLRCAPSPGRGGRPPGGHLASSGAPGSGARG